MNLPALASRSAFSVPYVDSELPCTEPRARNELLSPSEPWLVWDRGANSIHANHPERV